MLYFHIADYVTITRALKCKPSAKNNEHLIATLDMSIHEIEAVDKYVDNLELCMHEVQDSK